MIQFTDNELKFLKKKLEECRIATSHDDIPHIKPVSYIFEDGKFFVATDFETRTFKNIQTNPRAALSIDVYKMGGHKAVCIQGKALIIKKGKQFLEIYKKFHEEFEWVQNDPWDENEAPFIKIVPKTKTSWGLN